MTGGLFVCWTGSRFDRLSPRPVSRSMSILRSRSRRWTVLRGAFHCFHAAKRGGNAVLAGALFVRADPYNFSGEVRAALRERTRLMRDSYKVADPLGVVQIDHTVADVFVIDSMSRQPIGRPTLTVAIGVATRCVLGTCLSLGAPSSQLVALCLEHAVFGE